MNKLDKFKVLISQVQDLHDKTEDSLDLTINCLELCVLLVKKNLDYGSSALKPLRVFSKADSIEQINVRIDDKLSRVSKSSEKFFDEDVDLDLAGYLILRRLLIKRIQDSL
jgi:hypothetical protein